MNTAEGADSFLSRAGNKLDEARDHLKKCHYAESVSAVQESIEFSVKSLFLVCGVPFPKAHEVKELPFAHVVPKIPTAAKEVYNFPRILLLAKFWAEFYLVAKYGFEELGVGADRLFKAEEAELATKHASYCYNACRLVYERIRWPVGGDQP